MPQIPSQHRVYLIGDYHQHTEQLTAKLDRIAASNHPASVIFLGDYDIHTANDLSGFISLLSRYNLFYYLLRGNHDNPLYWQDRGITALFENERITLLKDVDYLLWGAQRILTISGAISVDRTCIRYDEGHCWPEIEGIAADVLTQVKKLMKKGGGFDVLLTHTGDLSDLPVVNPFTESYASTDEDLLNDLRKERKLIRQLQILSGVERHYFGHFHRSWTKEEFGIQMRCLSISEIIEL